MNFEKVARWYARFGWKVFPVYAQIDGVCTCRKGAECDRPAKHPRIEDWRQNATSDLGMITSWGVMYPDAYVGIATGESGLVVVDVDTVKHPESIEDFKALSKECPRLSWGWKVKTGSGGFHYYFRANPDIPVRNSQSKLGRGIDIRGEGGYVVAPPSGHASGGTYAWYRKGDEPRKIDSGPDEMPRFPFPLIEKLTDIHGERTNVDGVEMIPPGTRHSHFLSIAGIMRARGMNGPAILGAMRGINEAQCDPLHDDSDLIQIAEDYAKKDISSFASPASMVIGGKQIEIETAVQSKGRKKITTKRYSEIEERETDWLWDGYIAYSKLTVVCGLPGKGKSYLSCKIAALLSNGESFPGQLMHFNKKKVQTLLLSYEDGQEDTIKVRLRKCGADMTRVITVPQDEEVFTVDDVDALDATLEDYPDIRCIIIDPVMSAMGGAETGTDSKVREVVQPLISLAAKRKLAIILIAHLNKNDEQDIEYRIGGSMAFYAIPRSVLLVGHDNQKPYAPETRTSYGAIMQIKSNLGAYLPYGYHIDDNGFFFDGPEIIEDARRLLPQRKKAKAE